VAVVQDSLWLRGRRTRRTDTRGYTRAPVNVISESHTDNSAWMLSSRSATTSPASVDSSEPMLLGQLPVAWVAGGV